MDRKTFAIVASAGDMLLGKHAALLSEKHSLRVVEPDKVEKQNPFTNRPINLYSAPLTDFTWTSTADGKIIRRVNKLKAIKNRKRNKAARKARRINR